jgi:HK97 family phage portal protein
MRPSAVLVAPQFMTKEQRARYTTEFKEELAGAINAGKMAFLEGGFKLEALSLPPEDAQLLATRSFHVEQICRWFDMPPEMIGHSPQHGRSTSGTGMEQQMLWFLIFSLRPQLKRIEQAISRSLIRPEERRKLYAEFNVEGLLRADSQGRATLYSVLAQNGLRSRNELRALDNYAPDPNPAADELTAQVNLVPLSQMGQVPPDAAPQQPGKVQATMPTPMDGGRVSIPSDTTVH